MPLPAQHPSRVLESWRVTHRQLSREGRRAKRQKARCENVCGRRWGRARTQSVCAEPSAPSWKAEQPH
eukprot:6177254-Pleurochrysis_carterae.AAC.1